jgi:uncharacterized protein
MIPATTVEQHITQWLQRMVIDQNLCPFAKKPFTAGLVRIVVSEANNDEALLSALHDEISLLNSRKPEALETTLLVAPRMLEDFLDYNDFLDLADGLLEQYGWQGVYQIASFHPRYQFAETEIDDAENYTNRAPWPVLHILREASLETALNSYPNPENIPLRNIDTMQRLGEDALNKTLEGILKDSGSSH